MPTSVGSDDGCIRQPVAHGKQGAKEGFVLAPIWVSSPDRRIPCNASLSHRAAECGTGTHALKPELCEPQP